MCGAADAAPGLEDPETPNCLQLLTPGWEHRGCKKQINSDAGDELPSPKYTQ